MLTTVVIGSAAMFLLILSLTFILAKTVVRSEFDRLSGEEECDLIDNEEFFDMDNEENIFIITEENFTPQIDIRDKKKIEVKNSSEMWSTWWNNLINQKFK